MDEDEPLIDLGDGPDLVYRKVADHISRRIESGDLVPNAKLPSEKEMARQFGVSYDTVRRAMAVLRERGHIVTVHGRGTYVTRPQPQPPEKPQKPEQPQQSPKPQPPEEPEEPEEF
jgi:DNA-binding GntR family transcriptional regulator